MHTRITVSPGVELDVLQSGDPAGVPLLLMHGISDSAPSMRPLMEALPPNIRAIAITHRGHGESSKPIGPYTIDVMADDVEAVLDRLGINRAVVLGHSMSSIVAQRFASTRPDRITGLVLVGGFPGLKGNASIDEFYRTDIAGLQDPIDPAFARAFQESTLSRPVPPAFLDFVSAESCRLPAPAWKALFHDMMSIDTAAELAAIRAPTLLVWGDQDAFVTLADQRRLLAGIAGSALRTFEGVGHAPHWEEPTQAAQAIAVFIQRHVALVAA
ncbi:MAG: alpha/beta fold hydrolase [Pseudomonadota bacterium]